MKTSYEWYWKKYYFALTIRRCKGVGIWFLDDGEGIAIDLIIIGFYIDFGRI